jgi:hypothetical protein
MSPRSIRMSMLSSFALALPLAACIDSGEDAPDTGDPGDTGITESVTTARLSTSGTTIISAGTGAVVDLTGANTIRAADVDVDLMQQVGVNFVRVPINWARIENTAPTGTAGHRTHTWNETPLAELDAEIGRLEAAHIRVMLDIHQSRWSPAFRFDQPVRPGMPGWLYPSAHNFANAAAAHDAEIRAKRDFFFNRRDAELAVPLAAGEGPQDLYAEFAAMLVARYASHEYVVGLDMMNEPNWGPVSDAAAPRGANLVAFYDKVWARANPVAPKHYLWVYESVWLDAEPAAHPILDETTHFSKPHAVFSMHFYPKTPGAATTSLLAKLDRQMEIAHNIGQPFWLGEWDLFSGMRQTPTIPDWAHRSCALLARLRTAHSPQTVWAFERGASAWVEDATGQNDHNPGLREDVVGVLDGSACP